MTNRIFLLLSHVAILVFTMVLYMTSPGGNDAVPTIFYTAVAYLPGFAALYALRINGIGNSFGKTLLFFTIGLWSWIIAETIWFIFLFILHISPYPSISDVFYLLPYPLFLAGMVIAYTSYGTGLLNKSKRVFALDSVISIILTFFVAYFGIYLVYDPEVGALLNTLSITYGVVDLFLVIGALLTVSLVRAYATSSFGIFWMIMMAAFFSRLVADVLFAIFYTAYESGIKPYTYIDLLWVMGYLLTSYALFDLTASLKKIHALMREETSGILSK